MKKRAADFQDSTLEDLEKYIAELGERKRHYTKVVSKAEATLAKTRDQKYSLKEQMESVRKSIEVIKNNPNNRRGFLRSVFRKGEEFTPDAQAEIDKLNGEYSKLAHESRRLSRFSIKIDGRPFQVDGNKFYVHGNASIVYLQNQLKRVDEELQAAWRAYKKRKAMEKKGERK